MVDKPRRQRVQFEVTHTISPDDHGSLLLMKRIDNLLQRMRRRIEVVAIQLNSKPTATFVVNGHIPTAANTQIGTLRLNDNELLFVQFAQDSSRAIGTVVINNDDIVLKLRLLRQRALHGIGDGPLTVVHGNNHAGFAIKTAFGEVGLTIAARVNQRTHCLKMQRHGLFHLCLHHTVTRIDVVELPLAALPRVVFLLGIKIFVNVEQFTLAA